MAYNHLETMDIYTLIARWHAGYSISQISKTLKLDRKTIRGYIRLAEKVGLSRNQSLPEKAEFLKLIKAFLPTTQRAAPARELLVPHKDEIVGLITDKSHPLKPKTAYEVICERHELDVGYGTFKRFLRTHVTEFSRPTSTCRFETEPGEEVQIDYGKLGLIAEPGSHKKRIVYAFIATLSFSRLKFVDIVYRQDQRSFIASHLRMFDFFGGVPKRLVIDNLKSGVSKPNLYDPKLNLAYQEMAEHYGCFIDPARVKKPKDKGKVERAVPVVREMFRKFVALESNLDLTRANYLAHKWCLESNGLREHGTTHLKPYEVFQNLEREKLLPLPATHFEVATWKEAKVHVDQFVQFEKKYYSVPQKYIGQTVWIRGSEKLIEIFYQQERIKQHVRSHQTRLFDHSDFPENVQVMLADPAVQRLLERAEAVGPQFKQLLHEVLSPHAKLHYRRALALLNFTRQYPVELLEAAAQVAIPYKLHVPKQFERLLEKLHASEQTPVPISSDTQELLREADYFIHSPQ
jgi:transposase